MKKVLVGWFGKRLAVNGPRNIEQVVNAKRTKHFWDIPNSEDWPPVKCKVTLEWTVAKPKKGGTK